MTLIIPVQTVSVPLITVVLPAYNHAVFVVEAIESVRTQTLSCWQLIVIDDGSTDETWTVLQAYVASAKDPRIRILTQPNAGSHATLNRGLAMADTRYVAILNSDDRFAPCRLQRLLEVAQTMGENSFIVTGARLVDEHGESMDDSHWWNVMYKDILQRWKVAQSSSKFPAVETLLWGNFTISTSNFFMSRSLWEQVGPFKHLRYVPDWDFALRVASRLPQAFIFLADEALWDYRLHGRNTILGGALRNHAEAQHVLRTFLKNWAANLHPVPQQAIDRLHYLTRFIRHEHARQQLEHQKVGWLEQVEHQKVGWLEQVNALRTELDFSLAAVEKSQKQAMAHQQEIEAWKTQTMTLQKEAVTWQKQAVEWHSLARQMQESRSWQFTAPFRKLLAHGRNLRHATRAFHQKLASRLHRTPRKDSVSDYEQWMQAESVLLQGLHRQFDSLITRLPIKPLVSIVMPVHETPAAYLKAAVESVRQQWYQNWELCICNDASQNVETLAMLQSLQSLEKRIKVIHRETSGHIVYATNDAIALAKGEYVVFLDHDDQLASHALLRLVQAANTPSAPDFIYSDEDKLDEKGRRCLPLFKPQWSPVLEWSQNYVGHIMCVRRTWLQKVGGLLEGSQGSQDHDLVLRLAAQGARFQHIPEVLYHWRMHAASTSAKADAKPYAHQAGKDAVARHLSARYGEQFERVEDSDYTFVYQPRFRLPQGVLASIIVPTKDKADLLEACVQSIHRQTVGVPYEILVLDNGSIEPETQVCFQRVTQDARVRVIKANIPFNWSRLNNIGRTHAKGQVLIFLNNDTEVISPDWLQRLAEYALLPDVATVGPLLLYPDHTIQHAGVVVGMGGWADHVYKTESLRHYPTPFISSVVPRNVLANTGACMAISTARFDGLGGFDEAFEICGSDVEIGIRAHNQGYYNVYLPAARLYHFESKTRSAHVPEEDFQQSALKYAPYRLEGDPFFNPNLDPAATSPRPRFADVLAPVAQ